jgi:excisionase family DNA binding protein
MRKQGVQDRWPGLSEVAVHCGVSRWTVYVWLTRGRIRGRKVGRIWEIHPEDARRVHREMALPGRPRAETTR